MATEHPELRRFSAEVLAQFQTYAQRAAELRTRRYWRHDLTHSVRGTFEVGGGVSAQTEFPDNEDFRSLLPNFRLFYMSKEETHFPGTCRVLSRGVEDPSLRTHVAVAACRWRRGLRLSVPRFERGTTVVSPKMAIEEMLYGPRGIFHTCDPDDPRFAFARGVSPLGRATIDFIGRRAIVDLCKCIVYVDDVLSAMGVASPADL